LGESASFEVFTVNMVFAIGNEKKRKGKKREGVWGAELVGPISTKIGKIVGVAVVIIQYNFGFNIFRGFRYKGSLFPFSHCVLVIVTTVVPLPRSLCVICAASKVITNCFSTFV